MSENQSRASDKSSIQNFAIKTGIVAITVVASLLIVFAQLDSMIDERVDQIKIALNSATKFQPREFWPRLEMNIERAADPSNDLSPERKAKLVTAIHALRDRWKPILNELFSDPTPGPR